ncbi:MAG: DUF2019 domain-containing protein [Nitrospirae bacterium]|nr:DUF2019 domain-containing protein [Nitrospirota bacterium]
MVNKKNIDKLVLQFAESVIKQNEAIMAGDHKAGNKYAKKYIQCFKKLCGFGSEGKEALSKLLKHEDLGVREMAAAFLLNFMKYKTNEAMAVLKEIAKIPGLIGFGASEAIKRWEEGTWKLED